MMHIAPSYRAFAGGIVAGMIGVAVFAGAKASADPLPPAPQPVPAVAAQGPPAQNVIAPGGTSRFIATPPAANAFAPSTPAAVPVVPSTAAALPAPTPPTVTPAVTGTLRDYLQAKGVKLEAQKPEGFKALDITLPVPGRWTQVPDPNVPDAFAVIADRLGSSLYTSNAQVVVYKLVGKFDPKDAITHGFVDSQQLLAWQTTNASQADFAGFPSSVHRRHVPAKRDDAQHLAAPRHRHFRVGQVPGVFVGDHRRFRRRLPMDRRPTPSSTDSGSPCPGLRPRLPARRRPVRHRSGPPPRHPRRPRRWPPGQAALSSQTPPQQAPYRTCCHLVPGLPPLPNFNFAAPAANQAPAARQAGARPGLVLWAHVDRGRALHVCGGGVRRVRNLVAFRSARPLTPLSGAARHGADAAGGRGHADRRRCGGTGCGSPDRVGGADRLCRRCTGHAGRRLLAERALRVTPRSVKLSRPVAPAVAWRAPSLATDQAAHAVMVKPLGAALQDSGRRLSAGAGRDGGACRPAPGPW